MRPVWQGMTHWVVSIFRLHCLCSCCCLLSCAAETAPSKEQPHAAWSCIHLSDVKQVFLKRTLCIVAANSLFIVSDFELKTKLICSAEFLKFPHLSHAEREDKGLAVCEAENKRTAVTCVCSHVPAGTSCLVKSDKQSDHLLLGSCFQWIYFELKHRQPRWDLSWWNWWGIVKVSSHSGHDEAPGFMPCFEFGLWIAVSRFSPLLLLFLASPSIFLP